MVCPNLVKLYSNTRGFHTESRVKISANDQNTTVWRNYSLSTIDFVLA